MNLEGSNSRWFIVQIQDLFIVADRNYSVGCLKVKGAAATKWIIDVEAHVFTKASYDEGERSIPLVRRAWKHSFPMA